MRGKPSVTFRPRSCPRPSLCGRRSKGQGKELGRETAREGEGTPRALFRAQIPPSSSPFNACHAGYPRPRI